VYRRDRQAWRESAQLRAPDTHAGDFFGIAVAVAVTVPRPWWAPTTNTTRARRTCTPREARAGTWRRAMTQRKSGKLSTKAQWERSQRPPKSARHSLVAQTVRLAPGGSTAVPGGRGVKRYRGPRCTTRLRGDRSAPRHFNPTSRRAIDDTLGFPDRTETLGDTKYWSRSSKETVTISLPQPAGQQLANYSQHRLRVLPGQAHNPADRRPDSLPAALDDGTLDPWPAPQAWLPGPVTAPNAP
jgi:hypothetical protein